MSQALLDFVQEGHAIKKGLQFVCTAELRAHDFFDFFRQCTPQPKHYPSQRIRGGRLRRGGAASEVRRETRAGQHN